MEGEMKIYLEEVEADIPVTIIKLVGDIDASCFKEVIKAGQDAYNNGTRNLILDLSQVGFTSSSGLVALHSIALIMRGEDTPNLEEGWNAMHAAAEYAEGTTNYERHFKLLNPTPRVRQTLQKTGFDHAFEIFDNREIALASFN
jgi:anti-anti-sigma regulatory factor